MEEGCSFCAEPSVLHCMNRSLHHKYSDDSEKQPPVVDAILGSRKSALKIKYDQTVLASESREYLGEYVTRGGRSSGRSFAQLQEYYKYRIYVPVFMKSPASDAVLNYYYDKLKYYYNSIKRRLNITVQSSHSSLSEMSSSGSVPTKMTLLKEITQEMPSPPSIATFKSESKALEELVTIMKTNKHLMQIEPLRTEDYFQEQKLFEETIKMATPPKPSTQKHKLFKKIIEGHTQKKISTPKESDKQRPPSRSNKSIKVIRFRQGEQSGRNTPTRPTPFRVKDTLVKQKDTKSMGVLPKRNSSMTKVSPMQGSPYRRKSLPNQKKKSLGTEVTVAKATGRSRSIENLKTRGFDDPRIKQSLLKIQTMHFTGVQQPRTTPNSPSGGRSSSKQCIQITHQDNIISIRRKKLEQLKLKTARK